MSSPAEGYMFEIRPTRVSLVRRPANKRKFLVTKSEESNVMDEIIQIITETEASNEEALVETLKSQGKDDGTVQAALALARTLSAFSDSISTDELTELVKAIGLVNDETEEETAEEVTEETVTEEAQEEVTDEAVEADKAEEVADEAEEVEESDTSELDELRKRVAELESDNRKAELSGMVDGLQVGKTTDELADVLKAVDDAGGDVEQVVSVFRAADQAIKQSFGEIGSDLPGELNTDAHAAIEKAAREIMKSEKIGYAQAYARVNEVHPELVAEYYKDN